MKVKVLQNYQTSKGKIHLVDDIIDVDKKEYNNKLHKKIQKRKQEKEVDDSDVWCYNISNYPRNR